MQSKLEEHSKQSRLIHEENKKIYNTVQEEDKLNKSNIEATKKEITEKVENMEADFDAEIEITTARVNNRTKKNK